MSNANAHKPGYKHTPLGWIPEEWEVKTFDDVTSKILDGTHFSPKSKNGSFKYITSKNIRNSGLDLSDIDYITETEHKEIFKRCPVFYDDILLTKDGAGTGACCKNTLFEEFSLLSSVAVLRGAEDLCYNDFLYQYIKSSRGQFTIKDAIAGQAITRITLQKIRRFGIIIPSLPEQRKIAAILGTWDEAITKTQQHIAQLQQRNKGLMQQLLTRKKRLKGFKGEWREYSFEECFQIIRSYSISREGLSYDNLQEKIYCIHYGDIHVAYKTIFLDFNKERSIPQILSTNFEIKNEDLLKEGDIIMADASEDYDGVGEAVEIRNLGNRRAVGGLHTIVVRGAKEVFAKTYLAFLFASEGVKNELRKKATGTSVYSVSKTTLRSMQFRIPVFSEQVSIAEFLYRSIDEITIFEQQLTTLQQQKKGLMQKLLTGEVRVKI